MSNGAEVVDNRGRMRPLIGVTTSELRPSGASTLRRQGEPPHAEMALGMTYLRAIERAGGVALITADHGNAEQMLEPDGTSPHTAHTTNLVPLIVTAPELAIAAEGELADLIPTALDLLGFAKPLQMTGKSLLR